VATILRRIGRTVLVLTAAGFAGAALVETPQMLIPAAAVGALAGVVTYAVLVGPTAPPHALRRRAGAGAARIGGLAALLTLVVSGMAVLLGEATAPLLLLAVVIVVARSWRRIGPALTLLRAGGVPAPTQATPAPAPPVAPGPEIAPVDAFPPHRGAPLATFGTAALCATWQRTYHRLSEAQTEEARAGLVDLRRRCLDEFERRDPTGTARWLATEPRPAGTGPIHHLHLAPPEPPARES
jgi:hypothetical protein